MSLRLLFTASIPLLGWGGVWVLYVWNMWRLVAERPGCSADFMDAFTTVLGVGWCLGLLYMAVGGIRWLDARGRPGTVESAYWVIAGLGLMPGFQLPWLYTLSRTTRWVHEALYPPV